MCLAFAAVPLGCAGPTVRLENPSAIQAEDYDWIFDATVVELREQQFIVDRVDRRFGVVTTEPRAASTLLEPWRRDATTVARVGESTLNADRRIVTVRLTPQDAAGPEPGAAAQPPARYLLEVEVRVERRQLPPRQLTSSATGAVTLVGRHRDRMHRSLRTEEGRQEVFWKPVARDEHMEQRLLDGILTRASRPLLWGS
jgi:hypothetical protein